MSEEIIRGDALARYPIPRGVDMPEVLELTITDTDQFTKWHISGAYKYKGVTMFFALLAETTGLLNNPEFWLDAFNDFRIATDDKLQRNPEE